MILHKTVKWEHTINSAALIDKKPSMIYYKLTNMFETHADLKSES